MKKILKKICNVALILAMAITTFNLTALKVDAAETIIITDLGTTAYTHTGTAWWPDKIHYTWFTAQPISNLKVNGRQGFCIEPWILVDFADDGKAYGYNTEPWKHDRIADIVYVGYHESAKQAVDIATTQLMIWETLGYTPDSNTIPNYAARKKAINDKIAKLTTRPSFHNQTITINAGETVTLTDTKGVLSTYKGTKTEVNGVTVTRSGNTLTITATKDADETGTFTWGKIPDSLVGVSMVHRKSNSQAIAEPLKTDPVKFNLNIKVNKYGSAELAKKDENGTYIPNTTFKMSYDADMSNPIGEYKTGTNGKVVVDNLNPTTVYVQEVSVPEPLIVDTTIRSITIEPNATTSFEAINNIQKGKITVVKNDSETGNVAQGDATLNGAEFDVYNSDKSKVVSHLTSANPTTGDLALGQYFIKETKAPEGYKLNPNYIPVELKYAGQTETYAYATATVKDDIIKGKVSIMKYVDHPLNKNFFLKNLFNKLGRGLLIPGQNFVFDITHDATGQVVDTLTTNEEGFAESKLLPYGHYTITERETDAYKVLEPIHVFINEDGKVYRYNIQNEIKTTAITIVKRDAETGNIMPISGIGFRLQRPDGSYLTQTNNKLDTFYTDPNGYVYLPENVLYGETFTIREVKGTVPEKYLLNLEGQTFTTKGEETITIDFMNELVKGNIEVEKTGEVLVDTKTDEKGNIQFTYETQGLPGAKFNVYADEDIIHPDKVTGTIYKKDELITSLTTGADGKATLKNQYLGKYRVEEVTAPDGMVNNKEVKHLELKYKDETTAVVFDSASYDNERQKVEINLIKKDADTDTPLKDAVFGLFAKEDILSIDNKVLVKAGSMIEKAISNEKGQVVFKADLPLSLFEIKELQSPIGYISSDEVIEIDASYQGQDVKVIEFNKEFTNKITTFEFSKKDITTNNELPGAHLTLKEKDGEIFESWVSSNEPHIIKGLEPGKTYELIETSSPYGFAIAEKIEFTVEDTGEVQKVEMKDDIVFGQLSWEKKGSQFTYTDIAQTDLGMMHTPVFEIINILGAEVTIYAAEDIKLGNEITYYEKDEEIEVLVSDYEAVLSKKLPVGKYYYVETKTPAGFVPNTEKHYFEVEDNQINELQIIESTLKNERPSYDLEFTKKLEDNDSLNNPDAYKDVVFGIFTRDDTYDWKGNVAIEPDTLVATSGINAEGHLVNKYELPIGNYYLKEIATNSSYVLDPNEYDFSIDQSSEKEVIVKINDGKEIVNELKDFTVQVNKVDAQTNKAIVSKDFEFTRYADADGTQVIDKGTLNIEDGTATFDDVHYGVSYIKETKAPKGYYLSKEVVKVEVNDDGVFVNDKLIKSKEDVYSFIYQNTLMPTIKTGDESNMETYAMLLVLSSSLLGILTVLKRKKKLQ